MTEPNEKRSARKRKTSDKREPLAGAAVIARKRAPRPQSRPKRGNPEETRQRLVAAAATEFNRGGYDGTDSNRIARAAGYSAGVFYKHFPDKRAIYIAVYEDWVAQEWRSIEALLEHRTAETPRAIVEMLVALHKRWRVFRRSLRQLTGQDAEIRRAHVLGRKRQLDLLAELHPQRRDRARDLLLLYTAERAADAVAEQELDALGVEPHELLALLEEAVRQVLAR